MGTVQKEAQSKPGAEAPRGSLDDGGAWSWASGSAPAGADRGGCRERLQGEKGRVWWLLGSTGRKY